MAIQDRMQTDPGAGARPASEQAVSVSGAPQDEAGGVLSIDLDAIIANYRQLTRRATPAECAAVVKADAYGCGIEPVARALAKAGCATFFVAQLSEARQVRACAPDAVIYVLNGFAPGTAASMAAAAAQPVIGSLTELAEWDAFVAGSGWRGGAALQVDTGMNRLGVSAEESAALSPRINLQNHGITLIMSHFTSSEMRDAAVNDAQIKAFREVRMLFRGIPSSLANSSGIFLGPSAHCDMVRPGAALYGINPQPGSSNPMQPVVGLQGRVMTVRTVEQGAAVGYGGAWTAPRKSKLAVISVGYGDGYPRALSGTVGQPGGEIVAAGRRCPTVGRISMDLMVSDVTMLAAGDVRRGDLVTLIGGELTVDDLAARANTIGYEILTSLGSRYSRVYRGG